MESGSPCLIPLELEKIEHGEPFKWMEEVVEMHLRNEIYLDIAESTSLRTF